MRKLLLAGAASVGALTLATPQASAQNTQITAPTATSPQIRNEPGLNVRLAGRYRFYAATVNQDFQNFSTTAAGGESKNGSVDFYDVGRIWFGVDGMAQNGLRYGAQLQIRMGQSGTTGRGDNRAVLRYREMFGYVATPTLGQLRFGTTPGATQALNVGHAAYSGIGSGLWDGDLPTIVVGQSPSLFWWSSSGATNNTKIMYLSPQFFGFDLGVSFAPNDGTNEVSDCGLFSSTASNTACDRLVQSTEFDATRRLRNIFDVHLRYRGSFGPVGLGVSGGYFGADTIGADGPAPSYSAIQVGIVGANVSFAGFTLGGNYSFGRANLASISSTGSVTYGLGTPFRPLPSTTSTAAGSLFRDDDGYSQWSLALSYSIGPFGVGIGYHQVRAEGSTAASANMKDTGIGIGGSYNVAPGMNLFVEYIYGKREEDGVNLRTGAVNPVATPNLNSEFVANAFGIGVSINW
jgi:predicted porin